MIFGIKFWTLGTIYWLNGFCTWHVFVEMISKNGFALFLENVHFAKEFELTILSKSFAIDSIWQMWMIVYERFYMIEYDLMTCCNGIAYMIWWMGRTRPIWMCMIWGPVLEEGAAGRHRARLFVLSSCDIIWQVYHDNTYMLPWLVLRRYDMIYDMIVILV